MFVERPLASFRLEDQGASPEPCRHPRFFRKDNFKAEDGPKRCSAMHFPSSTESLTAFDGVLCFSQCGPKHLSLTLLTSLAILLYVVLVAVSLTQSAYILRYSTCCGMRAGPSRCAGLPPKHFLSHPRPVFRCVSLQGLRPVKEWSHVCQRSRRTSPSHCLNIIFLHHSFRSR